MTSVFLALHKFEILATSIRRKLSFDSIVFWCLVLADLYYAMTILYPATSLNTYLERDLIRSLNIASGSFPLLGPDTITGGYVWGGFFYFLIFPIVLISDGDPVVFILFTLAMRSIALAFTAWFFAQSLPASKTITFLTFTALSFWNGRAYGWMSNASYIPILLPLLAAALYFYFISNPSQSRKRLIYTSVFLGLCTQVHMTFIYFFIIILVGIWHSEKTAVKRWTSIGVSLLSALITLLPYLYVYITFRMGGPRDGPQFFTSGSDVFDYFLRLAEDFRSGQKSFNLFKLAVWQIEYLVVIGYLAVRAACLCLSRRRQSSLERDLALAILAIVLLNFSFFLADNSFRYQTLGLYLALAFLAFGFSKLRRPSLKLPLALLLFGFFSYARAPVAKPKNGIDRTHWVDFEVRDYKRICEFFNSRNVSFADFIAHSFEIMPVENEYSFGQGRFCFERQSPSGIESGLRYLIIHNLALDLNGKAILSHVKLPDEIAPDPNGPEPKLEQSWKKFSIFSYKASDVGLSNFERLGNLTFSYQVDSSHPLVPQANRWKSDFGFDPDLEITFQEARLCNEAVFCSIYLLSQIKNEQLRVLVISRVLQTIWDLPPVSATLDDLKLLATCDGKPSEIALASRIGNVSDYRLKVESRQTFRTPILLNQKISCQNFRPVALKAARETIRMNSKNSTQYNMTYPLREFPWQ
jgi:hypothetical protein